MNRKIINCFYNHFKNSSKKLKIVCDWDEVIQPLEPYALWLTLSSKEQKSQGYIKEKVEFSEYFDIFWNSREVNQIHYSPFGSHLIIEDKEKANQQKEIKNSPNFYQNAPFLSLAKELLILVKEKKAEVIFLSAFDQRFFDNGDPRKKKIFAETFGKVPGCSLSLVGFKSEKTGKSKSEWISENVPDCDILLDDNPNILADTLTKNDKIMVCAPYYPTIQQPEKVLLFKTSVADLKKEDFSK